MFDQFRRNIVAFRADIDHKKTAAFFPLPSEQAKVAKLKVCAKGPLGAASFSHHRQRVKPQVSSG